MSSTTKSRLAGLDHLRALAIILVFLWHYRQFENPQWMEAIGLFGWTGVDLFFVLSGYLIGGQLLRKAAQGQDISFKEFYFKRFFRIIPAYLVVLGLYICFPAFKERGELAPLWKYLTFTQNFGLDYSTGGAFSHAWSLCIEEQFYLLLPFIVMFLMSVNKKAFSLCLFFSIFFLGFVLRAYSWQHFMAPFYEGRQSDGIGVAYFKWIYYPTYNRLDGLLIGAGIAGLYHFAPALWARITRYGNLLLIIGLALIIGAYFFCAELLSYKVSVFGYPLVSVAFGFIVLAALSPRCLLYRFRFAGSQLIATLAYTIYLTHKQLIHLVQVNLPDSIKANSNLAFWICVAVCLVAAGLLHLLVERPFLVFRDRWINKRKQAAIA